MRLKKNIFSYARLAAAAVLLTFVSCIKPDDIQIVEVEQFGIESLTKPVVTVRVRNDSRRNIRILNGRFTLSTSSGRIGEVMLTDEIVIPKKSETSVTLPMRVKISNPLAAASLISGGKIDANWLRITGEAEVKAGSAKTKFTVTDAPVSKFISIFGGRQTNRHPDNE